MSLSFYILPILIGNLLMPSTPKDRLLPFPDRAITSREALAAFPPLADSSGKKAFALSELERALLNNTPSRLSLGRTRQGRPINAWYFPGTSDKRALVIGGMHGSELSSIEVAEALVENLRREPAYYSVIVIPSLFPDHATMAIDRPDELGSGMNIGRYSSPGAVDPNRQMPSPGEGFDEHHPVDH